MDFKNRLVGDNPLPPGAFFFVYDFWMYDEGTDSFRSLSDGTQIPEELLRRYLND